MKLTVGKWGNSLAVRLPRGISESLHLIEGDELEASIDRGSLLVTPVRRRRSTAELTKGMTASNRHPTTDWGPPVGKEVW